MTEVISAYSINLINSLLFAIIMVGGYLSSKYLLTRKVKSLKTRNQYFIRLKYFFFILYLVFFIKIWIEGFVQILAFIGFLSAAITLTQKDNLLNLIGWLIINWRGLFCEDDYIKISQYSGYVKSIGFLYFTLVEASPDFPNRATGRVIKIPNGLVGRNPVTNYSHEKFTECTLNVVFKPKSNLEMIEKLFEVLKEEMHSYLTKHLGITTTSSTTEQTLQKFEPKYFVKIRQEKPAGFEMVMMFYCNHIDKADMQYQINKRIIDFSKENEELTLAFD
ncbi:mechanosensitive ion channel family protein [Candidatus Berkiella aquae]|uniref:Mechanosensitive ion channel n=1 Tax=Candidatus Berkiella aquae TaxID=295108 RepID=A0A0Q9YUU8_9GAMM|nr:mechanosensitive ion channel domain-containing protein [Candidatus Berkiella aquae]MCS5711731.1 mechanosensitive ion channel family protein [Candidatus Berkiella aquae]